MTQKRTFEFTDRALKGLSIPTKPKQFDHFDSKVRGLGLRVSYGGRKSFFAMYINRDGNRQRLSLGEYGRLEDGKLSLSNARTKARAEIGDVAQGKDPAAVARTARTAPTVRTLATDFAAVQYKRGRKSADQQERILVRDVLPAIGSMKARHVRRGDIKTLLRKITDRPAPVLANRVHEIVRAMFNFGIEEEDYGLESNPADRLGKHRNPEQGRDRWLSLDEIRDYWTALDGEAPAAAAALRLCLLLGQRQANILGMRVDQLALEDRLWIIPASTTKTARAYKVPLSAAAVAIIEARIAELGGDRHPDRRRAGPDAGPVTWLFPGKGGKKPIDTNLTGNAHRSTCKRAGITGYTPHDSRHTFATGMEQMGIPRLVWDPIMGHGQGTMADLYSGHDFAEQRLDAMERWANRIAATMSENVVPIRQDTTA